MPLVGHAGHGEQDDCRDLESQGVVHSIVLDLKKWFHRRQGPLDERFKNCIHTVVV